MNIYIEERTKYGHKDPWTQIKKIKNGLQRGGVSTVHMQLFEAVSLLLVKIERDGHMG